MDVTELHDEENLLVQMQDRWENYGNFLVVVFVHYVLDETHTSGLRSIFGIES